MNIAADSFEKGDLISAISIYTNIIESKSQNWTDALLNRSSAFYMKNQYQASYTDSLKYLQVSQQPKIQGYILYANNLIKQKILLNQQQKNTLEKGKQSYPQNKKYAQLLKTISEIQITEDDQEFLDRIFQKLLSQPKIRNYMQEQSFLTKVQKMIKNPALASTLIKIDPRLADVQQIILMAQE